MVKAARHRRPLENVTNGFIASRLDEVADLLSRQGASEFRIRAYRRGAETLRAMNPPVADVYTRLGVRGLTDLPGIGDSLARSIEQLLTTGRLPLVERLRTDAAGARLFTTVADIGPKLAERIHDELGIETLTDLEAASWDGRLSRVPGMGPKRIRAVRESLAGRFSRGPKRTATASPRPSPDVPAPPVGELLEIDREYRRLADRDRLLRVAPRRFNPENRALAADPPPGAQRRPLHGDVLQHRPRRRVGRCARLGRHRPRQQAPRPPVDGDHLALGPPQRQARRPRPRTRMRRVVPGAVSNCAPPEPEA